MSWKTLKLKKLLLISILFLFTQPILADKKIKDGFLYLSSDTKAYRLTGEWLHFKEKSAHRQPDPLSQDWTPIPVPGLWKNIGIDHRAPIWYKLDFRFSRELNNKDLGLMTPNIAFAHEIYLNGKFLTSVGEFAKDGTLTEKSTRANFTILPKNLLLPKGKNTILLRVGSYGGVGGFNLDDVYLGKKDVIQEKYLRYLLWNTILVAIFIFVGLYHLVIYSARTEDKDYLYYSLMCFSLAIYNLCFTTLSYWVWNNFWLYYFGTIFSVASIPIFIIQFFHKFLEYRKRFLSKAIIAISIFFIFIAVVMNVTTVENFARFNSVVLKVMLSVLGISLFYPIYFIIIGIKRGRIGSRVVIVGYSIFIISVSNDVLIYLNFYSNIKFVEVGFLAFIMGISFAMALKFAHVHKRLEYLTNNLKEEVGKRTAELTETNKQLVEMDRMKTSFFANVTHELRTPLTLSLLPLERVIQTTQDSESLELLETAHRNNIKLLKLINDLLDFAKIEAGLMSLRLAPTNLSKLLDGLISAFQMNAKFKNINVTYKIQPEANVAIDPEKIEKVITNLLSNAYKFTNQGGTITITLDEYAAYNTKEYYRIRVIDTGIGIPEDKLDYIFERFHQLDMTKERNYEGTGIGLSLVKELTELHEGFVEVKSRLDEGSEFSVYIPKIKSSNLNLIDADPKSMNDSFSVQYLHSMGSEQKLIKSLSDSDKRNLLLVEDNSEMVYLLNELLKNDYNLNVAKNAFEGLEIANELRPDLIISDVMMPGMNGFEFTKKIRESKILKQTPIILLTAMNDLDGKLEGFNQGADDYISKPFQPLELKARINGLIQKSNLQKEKNHRLSQLQKELILARDIQSKLLPQSLPDIKNLSLAPMYIPLDEVGGDFYDIHIENEYVYVFMCDVSGHGVPACLIASMVKMAFQNEIRDRKNKNIAHVMKGINRSLFNIIGNNFVTASLARINITNRMVKFVTAGHPPFYLVSNGKTIPHHSKGRPLGLFEDFDIPIQSFQAEERDMLFFYTDGIIETSNITGEFYEEERLESFLSRYYTLDPHDILDALSQELRGFLGDNKFEDDITALAVKFLPGTSTVD
ncbi:MAG: SpoIIE family protein phosphatase [Leptospira sp.]|nr:SpoIIE family protein phosphatase [Leptospira sp.]